MLKPVVRGERGLFWSEQLCDCAEDRGQFSFRANHWFGAKRTFIPVRSVL
jgi:hypothetical protein